MKILLGLFCLLLGTAAMAQVPNTFQSGQTASAAEVNENFADLDMRVSTNTTDIGQSLGGIILTRVSVSDISVTTTLCPADSLIVSAQCTCGGDTAIYNLGVLFSCSVAGNAGIAACHPDSFLFDFNLAFPLAELTVVCASAIQNDGTPVVPVSFKGSPLVSAKPDDSRTEYEAAVNDALAKIAEHTIALQNR